MNQSIFAYGYLNNGLVYSKQGKFDKAIIEFNKAIEESPQYAAAYQNRANAYQNLMNFEEAFKDYSMAIRINPQYSAAYFNRGFNYSYQEKGLVNGKQGKFEEAIMDYTKFIQMVPDNAHVYIANVKNQSLLISNTLIKSQIQFQKFVNWLQQQRYYQSEKKLLF